MYYMYYIFIIIYIYIYYIIYILYYIYAYIQNYMLGSVTTCNHQKTWLLTTAQVYPNTCGQKIPKEHLPCPLLQMPWDHLRSETKLGTSTKEIKGNKIKQRNHVFDKQQHKL